MLSERDTMGRFIKGSIFSPIQKGHKVNLGKVCSIETRKKIGLANSKPKVIIICGLCKIEFGVWPSKKDTKKYCSKKCQFESQKGQPSWNKGLKGYRAGIGTRPNIMPKGETHWSWKGGKSRNKHNLATTEYR